MEDEQIISLYWQRNEAAIAHTEAKYGAYCQSIAYRILEDAHDAEETVNDTYLRTWNTIPPQWPSNLTTYLGKITRNLAIDRRRRRRTKKRGSGAYEVALEELSSCLAGGDSPEELAVASELTACIDSFLGQLPSAERRVFIRRYWHFCSISEIAAQYGYSLTKTKTMLYRARKQLRQYLVERGVMNEI